MCRADRALLPLIFALATVLAISIASSADATIWNVYEDGTGDAPTIHAAIDSSANGDTILVGCGDYYGPTVYWPSNDLRIHGVDGDSTCVRLHFLFEFYSGMHWFENLTFASGSAVGIGFDEDPFEGAQGRFQGCVFDSSWIGMAGSGWFTDCVFQNGARDGLSSVAGDYHGGATFNDCIFRENHGAPQGGAVWASVSFGMTFNDCLFENNSSTGNGGAAYGEVAALLAFNNCEFRNNTAALDGGAIAVSRAPSRLIECLLTDNQAGRNGGAIAIDTTFASNSPKNSLLWNCTLYGNSADSLGGAIYNNDYEPVSYDGKLWILNTIIAGTVTGEAIHTVDQPPAIFCTDIWGNAGGDWTGPLADSLAVNNNFSLNPKFCDAAQGNFDLKPSSPCLDVAGCPGGATLVGYSGAECALQATDVAGAGDAETSDNAFAGEGFFLATPNPFRGDVTLRFASPVANAADLVVFDLRGREVTRTRLLTGARTATWDGRDESGRPVSPGTYFLQLSDGTQSQTAKITLLR